MIDGETVMVFSNGRYKTESFVIDKKDMYLIAPYSWRVYTTKGRYKRVETSINQGNGKIKHILLSRFLLDAPPDKYVDHIDCDPSNNRRNNLRFASIIENGQNCAKSTRKCSSTYKGVAWHKSKNKWIVSIQVNRKSHHIGYFTNEILAANAYDQKAKELFGEFANVNFH